MYIHLFIGWKWCKKHWHLFHDIGGLRRSVYSTSEACLRHTWSLSAILPGTQFTCYRGHACSICELGFRLHCTCFVWSLLNDFSSIFDAELQLFCLLHGKFLEISNSVFYTGIKTMFWFQLKTSKREVGLYSGYCNLNPTFLALKAGVGLYTRIYGSPTV